MAATVTPVCKVDDLLYYVRPGVRSNGRRTRISVVVPWSRGLRRDVGTCSLGDLTDLINDVIDADQFLARMRWFRPVVR